MTDPIQRDSSLFDWIRDNWREGLRRLVICLTLVGVLLYIVGEIFSHDGAIRSGIRLLLAGIAGGVVYKLVAFVDDFLENQRS